jgi:hypothetical protein
MTNPLTAEELAELKRRHADAVAFHDNPAEGADCRMAFNELARKHMPALIATAERASKLEWQPMETAPRDGSEILLAVEQRAGVPGRCLVGHYMPGGHCIEDHPAIDEGWYFWNGCQFDRASKPRHWMPLPEINAALKG